MFSRKKNEQIDLGANIIAPLKKSPLSELTNHQGRNVLNDDDMIVFKEDKARKILKTAMKLFIEGAEKQVLL